MVKKLPKPEPVERPEIIYSVAASLDGFIAPPDGSADWLTPVMQSGEDYGLGRFYASVGAILMGSRTYEQSLGHTGGGWGSSQKPCWVFSKRSFPKAKRGVIVTKAEPCEVVAELASRGIARAWFFGGTRLASSFRSAGLITEWSLALVPVLLGGGTPLFESPGTPARLRLLESKVHPSGVIQVRYQVV
jgi:dihydrofolate reductase